MSENEFVDNFSMTGEQVWSVLPSSEAVLMKLGWDAAVAHMREYSIIPIGHECTHCGELDVIDVVDVL